MTEPETNASAAPTRVRDRIAWFCYGAIFLAIPFVLLVFRLHMQAWHYYLAGGLFLLGALILWAIVIAD